MFAQLWALICLISLWLSCDFFLFEESMDDWDQETLEKVVESKKTEYKQNKPTDIVSFLSYVICTTCKLIFFVKSVRLILFNFILWVTFGPKGRGREIRTSDLCLMRCDLAPIVLPLWVKFVRIFPVCSWWNPCFTSCLSIYNSSKIRNFWRILVI